MPRLTGPLFSLTARKTLGKAITYSSWRGVQYARQRVIPTNPQTTAQTDARNIFSTLNALWLRLGPMARAPWEASASGQPYTDRNRFLQVNVPLLQGTGNMQAFEGSPGVGGAVPPVSVVDSSPGAGAITLTAVQPTLPTGWSQSAIVGVAFIDGDPATPLTPLPFEFQDAAAPYTIILMTGLATGTYTWSCWNVLVAPDGTTRYSPSTQGVQIVA